MSATTGPGRPPESLFLACDLQEPGAEAAARATLRRLSAHDRERVARLHRSTDRTRSVLARRLALQAAGRLLGIPWTGLRLGRHHQGRPYVTTHPRLSLSMAHSGRYAVAAAALGACVGVDVEEISRVSALPDSAFLTPAEITSLPPAGAAAEHRAALWALKEAATKLTGEGMRAGMKRVAFRREGAHAPFTAETPYTDGGFTACRLPGGYVCAVGVSAGTPPAVPTLLTVGTAPQQAEPAAEESAPHIWLSVN
ncbi:4'-phosphopantetheinyl transferase family protein [Streptomyces telluris]|uniref:4'-phosphopantetheinyl transferase superfamily protein n=1 Tax=Streptomyces telluris TaxID=2720021 RepID=A0A9X2LDE9_9ACTN|nr:4'-phosphopantetheinyl transferase superfamily protein [Streptomyces telluris]MCQ8769165.1 4'-phosphopantetheinyl transferase superfamily protein [Streptomyces telluris]NJP75783.1 4'-phosphopantetheinyl transferase superfamily protein [Streptomyces telluris]